MPAIDGLQYTCFQTYYLTNFNKSILNPTFQLPSILPVEHQRLVKYPLLLEQLLKQCDREADPDEYNTVKRCVDRTREILESIDRQVAEAQNIQRLAEIQRFLDTSGLEKMQDSPICAEYRVS